MPIYRPPDQMPSKDPLSLCNVKPDIRVASFPKLIELLKKQEGINGLDIVDLVIEPYPNAKDNYNSHLDWHVHIIRGITVSGDEVICGYLSDNLEKKL